MDIRSRWACRSIILQVQVQVQFSAQWRPNMFITSHEARFYCSSARRYDSAIHAIVRCLSVRHSHAGIVSKRPPARVTTRSQCRMVAARNYIFWRRGHWWKSDWVTPIGASNTRGVRNTCNTRLTISRQRYEIGTSLVWTVKRKSHVPYVPM